MKKFLIALLFAPLTALASGGAHLDKWPGAVSDKAALQNGAKLFVNYCLNCHGASHLRYKNLTDLGLTEQQVKDNLMFTSDKIGDLMRVAARSDEQKKWFGATPPDLTVIARARRLLLMERVRTGSTPTCAPSTKTTSARPAGTTWFSRMSACRTSSTNCRARKC